MQTIRRQKGFCLTEAAAPPAAPTNAVEARGRLDTLIADKDWGAKLLAGDTNANREFRDLQSMADKSDDSTIAMAMSGNIGDMPDSSVRLMANTADMLREVGIREEIIEQTLRGHEVSAAEYKLVEAYKARQMKDPVFVKAYLSGDSEARQKVTLMNIILSGGITGEGGSF
jgi:hypothetical protein